MPDDDVPDWWEDGSALDALRKGGDEGDAATAKIMKYLTSKYQLGGKGCHVVATREAPGCFEPMKAWVVDCGDISSVWDDVVVKELDAHAKKAELREYYSLDMVKRLLVHKIETMARKAASGKEPTCPKECSVPKEPAVWTTECDYGRVATGEGKGRCTISVKIQCGTRTTDGKWFQTWSDNPHKEHYESNVNTTYDVKPATCFGFGFVRVCSVFTVPYSYMDGGGGDHFLFEVNADRLKEKIKDLTCPGECVVREVQQHDTYMPSELGVCAQVWYYCSRYMSDNVPDPPRPYNDWPWKAPRTRGGDGTRYRWFEGHEHDAPVPVGPTPPTRTRGRRRSSIQSDWLDEREMLAELSAPQESRDLAAAFLPATAPVAR